MRLTRADDDQHHRLFGAVVALATRHAGQLKVVKVDVDEASETAAAFGVTAMPTFVVVKDGKETFRRIGAAPKSTLASELRQAI